MEEQKDYTRDIAEIRTMMERSSKFFSLSGWAGVLAGVYALAGAFVAYSVFEFQPTEIFDRVALLNFQNVFLLAVATLILAITTAVFLSHQQASKSKEKIWNATTKRWMTNMAVPLVAGGMLILILISNEMIGLVAPLTLVFYGLALFAASKYTYDDFRILGLGLIGLGVVGAYAVEWSLLCWALGFGVGHIVYGIYLHFKYGR